MTIPELIEQYQAARDAVVRADSDFTLARESLAAARRAAEDAGARLAERLGGKAFVHGGKSYWGDPYTGVGVCVSELAEG